MIAIKDMEMPKNCCECEFRCYDEEFGEWYCSAMSGIKNIESDVISDFYYKELKHSNCPLVEVEVK